MVLLRCINYSRHLLIHTFIRTVAGHNHYSIYVIKKRERRSHTYRGYVEIYAKNPLILIYDIFRVLLLMAYISFRCCLLMVTLFFFFFNFWFQVESLCSFLVYIILIMVRFVILFGVVICIANECWRVLWCDGTNYEKRFCLGIFVTLDRNCSHQHFHTTHYHLCGTVKHT